MNFCGNYNADSFDIVKLCFLINEATCIVDILQTFRNSYKSHNLHYANIFVIGVLKIACGSKDNCFEEYYTDYFEQHIIFMVIFY